MPKKVSQHKLLVREINKTHLNPTEAKAVVDLLKNKPLVIHFQMDERSQDRQEKLNNLSTFDQELVSFIIHQYVADFKEGAPQDKQWGVVPTDPYYYMPVETEDIPEDDWDLRGVSPDWRFIIYSNPDSPYRLIDLNGWPGDNEMGIVGLIYEDTLIVVAINSDSELYIKIDNEDVTEALTDYQEIREETFAP